MSIGGKELGIMAVAVIGIGIGAYTIGVNQGAKQQEVPVTQAAPAEDTKLQESVEAATASLPAGHPTTPAQPEEAKKAGSMLADPNAKFTHFRVGNRNVKAMYSAGNIMWVGTSAGVVKYDTKTDEYTLYDNRRGLLSNGVFYVGPLGDKIAIGTYGGGLSVLDPATETMKNYNVPHGLADAFVYEVLEASNGDVWIATWSGANRIVGGDLNDRKAWVTYTVENTDGGLPNDWVYGLAEGKDGVIWLGTEGGMARFAEDSWENWSHNDGLGAEFEAVKSDIQFNNDPGKASSHHARQKVEQGLEDVNIAFNPNYVISMEVDHNGVVWGGTWGGGLARFENGKWKNYTVKDGLPANHIFMLREDKDGVLWIGTNSGLTKMQPDGSFKSFDTTDGLFSNSVFSMAEGSDGSRWVGSFGGVARIVSLQ